MNTFTFGYLFFRRFPKSFLYLISLLSIQGLFAAFSVVSIAPIVDLFLHPDLQGMSPITLKLIQQAQKIGLSSSIFVFIGFFLSSLILKNVFFTFARWLSLRLKYQVLQELSQETLESFFKAKWIFFSNASQGTFFNTFLREIGMVGDAFGQLGLLIANISQVLIFLIVPLVIAWEITLICILLAVLCSLPILLLGKINYRMGQENTRTANITTTALKEIIGAAKVIMGFGERKQGMNWYITAFDAHRQATIKSQTLSFAMPLIYEPLGMLALFGALLATKVISIPISETAVVIWGLHSILPLIGQIVSQRNLLRGFLPSYEQVQQLKQTAQQWEMLSGTKIFTSLIDPIRLTNVSFTYPGKDPILVNLNLQFPRGKMIAVVGKSGSGKSTLIDLLLGLNSPDKGKILLNGNPLQEYDLDSYRQKIGYVPQDAVLFNMSIRDNLLWANAQATERELWKSCDQANATEFIEKLPEGLDTIIGDRGIRLSGGQCQRLALARALVRKPELLVLDEATSALDTESERLIQQAIDHIAGSLTIVVIAHRLSTIAHADYVYVLKEGSVLEEGTYKDLLDRKSVFYSMVQSQQQQKSNAEIFQP
ncbi:ABC transporter ATP-binding protein [Deltaproteobacteria bacterium TL4]